MGMAAELLPCSEANTAPVIVCTGFSEEILPDGFTLFTLYLLENARRKIVAYVQVPTGITRPPDQNCVRGGCPHRVMALR